MTVIPETRLTEVIRQMQERANHNCTLVMKDTQLQRIFTERDLVRLIAAGRDLAGITVAEVMNRELITLTLTGSEDAFTALNLLRQHSIRHLPVIDKSDRR